MKCDATPLNLQEGDGITRADTTEQWLRVASIRNSINRDALYICLEYRTEKEGLDVKDLLERWEEMGVFIGVQDMFVSSPA